jgi:hypothetical protein
MFNETVMDYAGDVLLYLYMDGCPHCDKFSRIYSEAAMELHSTDTDVRFLAMRGPRNDADHDRLQGSVYPRAYLFAEGEKETPYEYRPTGDDDGSMSADHFRTFVEVFTTVDVVWWHEFLAAEAEAKAKVAAAAAAESKERPCGSPPDGDDMDGADEDGGDPYANDNMDEADEEGGDPYAAIVEAVRRNG